MWLFERRKWIEIEGEDGRGERGLIGMIGAQCLNLNAINTNNL